MLNKGLLAIGLFLGCSIAFAQSSKKLTKEESASLTSEQRIVRESDRKSKHGKKNLSLKKKVKISQKQDRRVRSIKDPKTHKNKR
jgi:hypothetical protein